MGNHGGRILVASVLVYSDTRWICRGTIKQQSPFRISGDVQGAAVFGVSREQALWALSYMQCLCNARGSGSVTSSMPLSIDFVLCANFQVVAQYGNGGVPTNQLN